MEPFKVGPYVTPEGEHVEVLCLHPAGVWVIRYQRGFTYVMYRLDPTTWNTLRPRPTSGARAIVGRKSKVPGAANR